MRLPGARLGLAPGIGEEAQRPRRRDLGIELAQRAGGGVARIGVGLLAGRVLPARSSPGTPCAPCRPRRARRRPWAPLPFSLCGMSLMVRRLARDVLAGRAVAARRALDELAVLVAQADRQAVDLGLAAERDLGVGLEVGLALQAAAQPVEEALQLLVGEGIVERQHRPAVADLGEGRGRRRRHPLRRAVHVDELREARLDRLQPLAQLVVVGVGDLRRVLARDRACRDGRSPRPGACARPAPGARSARRPSGGRLRGTRQLLRFVSTLRAGRDIDFAMLPPLPAEVRRGGYARAASSVGGGARLGRHLGARQHAGDLLAAALGVERQHVGAGGVAGRRLADQPVPVGDRRDLRRMRDHQHLDVLGQPLQPLADGGRGGAADARIDLVEHDGRRRRPPWPGRP